MEITRKAYYVLLHHDLENDQDLQALIADSHINPDPLAAYLSKRDQAFGGRWSKRDPEARRSDLFHHMGELCKKEGTNAGLVAASASFKISRQFKRNSKRDWLVANQMTRAYRENTDIILQSSADIANISLPKLRVGYPPRGVWICESEAIQQLWDWHIRFGKQADPRLPRHAPIPLDSSKLQCIVDESTSCIIRDDKTNEIVLLVLRNVSDPNTLPHIAEVVATATSVRRNVRKEDAGTLIMSGWSAGSRSRPSFHWVRNIVKKRTPSEVDLLNMQECHVFAYFWNLLKHRLPSEIKEDFDLFLETTGLPRMEASGDMESRTGSYTLNVGSESFTFNNVALAPPAGVMGQNYARAMHYEKQPHKYGVSFTAERNGDKHHGGHFYIGSYGIKVEVAANTIIAWQPGHTHGTSLLFTPPGKETPDFIQRGMSFVTSNRLPGVWRKYKENLKNQPYLFHEQAAREAEQELWDSKEGDDIFV